MIATTAAARTQDASALQRTPHVILSGSAPLLRCRGNGRLLVAFKATDTVITMHGRDLVRLQEILIDGDEKGALSYLNDVIAEKLTCAQTESHRPAFEGGEGDVTAHYLQKGEGHPDAGETG